MKIALGILGVVVIGVLVAAYKWARDYGWGE